MYNYKLKFTKKPEADGMDAGVLVERLISYWKALYHNGQVVGGFDVFSDDGHFYLTAVLPEEDSLSDSYNNVYARERLKKLNELFEVELIREGLNLENCYACTCEKPSGFCLSWNHADDESPLFCEDCALPIPLYKVPYILGDLGEHLSIVNWQNACQRMYGLWFHGSWDRFTYGELSKHNSKLNREGRKICKALEKVLGVPVYYYLFSFHERDKEVLTIIPRGFPNGTPKACPQCGGAWEDDGDFVKCEKCRLKAVNRGKESDDE